MFIIPIDIAKFHHCASVFNDATGECIVKPFYFDNTFVGIQSLFDTITPFIKNRHIIDFESTGHYGDNLLRFLLNRNCYVGLINPIATSTESKKRIRKTKNDKIDTHVIYRVIRHDDFTHMTKQKLAMREAKTLMRCYSSKKEELNKIKNKLQKHIDLIFPELNTYFKTKYSKLYMLILKEFDSAYNLANSHLNHIKKVLTIKGRGNHTSFDPKQHKKLVKTSIGEYSQISVLEIICLIKMIEYLNINKNRRTFSYLLYPKDWLFPRIGYLK